ncbi:two-component regulator propeller domain-containing protein [Pedobacter nototheniae]|uniref:hybrid sensor histidine kinase/response regulator transcription factor n=1 Tax=Pedobacter nototheniae TaxID=2488994 RepID=UPI002930BA33|nr:two-component regulator propeller domain-containing protein [Pedobacter nototheniae]
MKQLFTFFLLFHSVANFAQNNSSFKHLNVENGLSQSSVLSITQDARGFMWFGTRFGLNKYDSRNFKIYKHDPNDAGSLINSQSLSSILSAKDGSIWIGSPVGINKYNEGQDNFDSIVHHSKEPKSLSNSKINCLFQDRENRIWVGTGNGLNLLTNKKKYYFQHFLTSDKLNTEVFALTEDHAGNIWIGTGNGLIVMKIKNHKATFQYLKTFSDQINRVNDNHVTSIVEDRENNLWIGTKQTGLNVLNLQTGVFKTFKYSSLNTNGISSNNIRKIILDQQGKLWIGTLHGISIYNPNTKTFSTLQNEPENKGSLSQNSVYDIFQDKQGIIWVGTYYGGINMVYPDYTPFKVYKSTRNGLSSNVVSAITEDTSHNLWIGTEGEGLNYFDRKKNTYTHYKYNPNNPNSLSSNLVKSIFKDKKNRIWIGTHLGGLNLYLPKSNSFVRFTNKPNDPFSISSDAEITSIFEDSYGRFWIGTSNGLNSFEPATGKFVRKQVNGLSDAVFYIFEDSSRRLLVATNSGLYILTGNSNHFTSLPYGNISCITEDKQGMIWLGTMRDGIYKLNAQNRKIGEITTKNGLPSNNIVGILEDDVHNLWISTDNGLCKYNPAKKSFKTFNIKDGLPGNEFNYKSILKDSNGEFFFGGLSGFISFMPGEIKENKIARGAVFTELKLFNKPVKLNTEEDLLKSNISNLNSITFKANQNVFSIDFTVLNFIKPDKNIYAYKLIGFEKNWNYVNTPTASYTNLSPGDYKLLVKGSNNDGLWAENPTTLNLKILPPFYKTWWAYLIYFCMVTGILVLGVRYLLIRAVLKKEKEINEHKLEFFTNISHEIRTPLTLIVGPLENIIGQSQDNPQLNKQLLPIKNNADRLMNLVTELLDFRKAESGKMTLQVSPGNLVKFCQEIFLAFQNMAISKNIAYSFETETEEIIIYFDKIQLEKVFFNILSNAFKFTPDGGEISLKISLDKNAVNVNICDTGKGIPLENQANLFNNFYQANPNENIGTGLGLSFSKSITTLHKGNISFESRAQQNNQPGFTCFTIHLKTGKEHFQPSDFIQDYVYYDDATNYTVKTPETAEILSEKPSEQAIANKGYNLLLVEDNAEVRNFIRSSLQNNYTVNQSEDGLQGWQSAIETIPDLIISDVMMPNMDGLELCRKLKTDERTSHIPIILLTARSAYVHQINGFENGADAYIMKPFNLRMLELNIINLLNARETIKKKFAQVVKLEPKNLIINTTEQNFLHKIISIIEDRITDSDFDVPALAAEIGMSQPVLYKKIRALTDLSVNDFVKSIRLKKAAQLLKLNQGNISEIAYSVGFNDRKYFSLEFKKYFGKTPSEFIVEDNV